MKTKTYVHVLTNIPGCSYWSNNILKRDLGLLYLLVQINGHQDHQVPLGRPVCQLFQRWFWVNYAGQHQVPDHLLAVEQHVQQWRPDPECHQRLGRENLPGNEDFAVWWNQVNSFFLCFISCIFNGWNVWPLPVLSVIIWIYWDGGCWLLHWYPKLYKHLTLLVGSETLGTFTDLLVQNWKWLQPKTFSNEWVILFIIMWDAY